MYVFNDYMTLVISLMNSISYIFKHVFIEYGNKLSYTHIYEIKTTPVSKKKC